MAGADPLRRVRPRCAAVTDVPVRLPLPPAKLTGSIYETQRALEEQLFRSAGARVPDRGPLIRASRGTAGGRRALSSRSDGDA